MILDNSSSPWYNRRFLDFACHSVERMTRLSMTQGTFLFTQGVPGLTGYFGNFQLVKIYFLGIFFQGNHHTFWYADLFVLEEYLQFSFNEINEGCGNYIALGRACF